MANDTEKKSLSNEDLKTAASAAGATKPGDYFVCNNMLFSVDEHGFQRRDDGDLDIKRLGELLEARMPHAEKLAAIASTAADAAREKWGAGGEFRPFAYAVLGSSEDRQQALVLGNGKYPSSRSYNTHYVRFGREDSPDYEGFDGHRYPWHIEISESNYLKTSGLSGNEVRKSCSVLIYVTTTVPSKPQAGIEPRIVRKLVYATGAREAEYALQKLPMLLGKLMEHTSQLWDGDENDFSCVVDRKVFYRDQPAVIRRYLPDQGAVIIESEDGKPFRRPVWADDDRDDDAEASVKTDLFDEGIWWWRK